MKIYFSGSITAGRDNVNLYEKIVKYLENFGEVLTTHVADKDLSVLANYVDVNKNMSDEEIYKRDLKWCKDCDVLIAEVSIPSFGVGTEIAWASEMNKKILCLYRNQENKRLSPLITGNKNLSIKKYDEYNEDIEKYIKEFLEN